jgi:DNA-binding transcriptional LysR family regulator
MELQQLTMLLAVTETGTYSKAGELLCISHSAIHRQIRILEEEVHCRILVRNGRRVELTDAGHKLVAVGRRIRQDISDTVRQINEANEIQRGTVRIGTADTILFSYLLPILKYFRKQFPGVDTYVITSTAGHVFEMIMAGDLDMGIVFNPAGTPPKTRNLVYEVLFKDDLVWATGRDHPLARRSFVTIAEMAEFPFVMLPKTSHIRQICEHLLKAAGVTPKISMELENEEAIEKGVEANLGIALLPASRVRKSKVQHIKVSKGHYSGEVALVLPRRDYIRAAVAEFAQLCRKRSKRPVLPSITHK